MSAKKWAVILAAVFVVAATATFLLSRKLPENVSVGIYSDGILIHTIYPEIDGEYVISSDNGGYNVVTVIGGKITMSDADCPDRVCVKHGALHDNDAIICVPNKVVVRTIDSSGGIDAVTGR